jgi:hypothetical protein
LIFLMGLGLCKLRTLSLQSRCSTAWARPPAHFALVILGWPQTSVLLTSASQVARITCVSHWHLAFARFLIGFLGLFYCIVVGVLYIFWILIFYHIHVLHVFSSILQFFFFTIYDVLMRKHF